MVYAYELWVFATCPALRGSTVSYAGVAHVSKNCLEYSLNFWSHSKKKIFMFRSVFLSLVCMEHSDSESDFELQEVVCSCSYAKKQMKLISSLK